MKKTGWFRRFCEWGARRLLGRLHRVTHRMPVELRPVQPGRALIVAPHMDDEVIGPGGAVALHREAGGAIGVSGRERRDSGDRRRELSALTL